ncbi:hypothetical protein D3C72_2303710 [compost metagenome]
MTHAEYALARLTHYGEGFRQQVFQHFTLFQACAELVGLGFQFVIGQFFHVRFHLVDQLNRFAHAAQRTIVTATKNFGQ